MSFSKDGFHHQKMGFTWDNIMETILSKMINTLENVKTTFSDMEIMFSKVVVIFKDDFYLPIDQCRLNENYFKKMESCICSSSLT